MPQARETFHKINLHNAKNIFLCDTQIINFVSAFVMQHKQIHLLPAFRVILLFSLIVALYAVDTQVIRLNFIPKKL